MRSKYGSVADSVLSSGHEGSKVVIEVTTPALGSKQAVIMPFVISHSKMARPDRPDSITRLMT